MRLLLLFIGLLSCSYSVAQTKPSDTINQLWQALSREPNQTPDIAVMKSLLHPEAMVYGAQLKEGQHTLSAITGSKFIELLDKAYESGFYECEVARTMQVYDRFAHVYSVVESRSKRDQIDDDFVGVNSIQLYKMNDEWKILSLYYHIETPDNAVSLEGGVSGVCLD